MRLSGKFKITYINKKSKSMYLDNLKVGDIITLNFEMENTTGASAGIYASYLEFNGKSISINNFLRMVEIRTIELEQMED